MSISPVELRSLTLDERREIVVATGATLPLIESMAECGGWTVNPYTACDLRCTYCITGAAGTSTPRVPRDEVRGRLRDELATLPEGAALSIGTLCDAYPRAEAGLGLTREVLEVLVEDGWSWRVVTKGAVTLLRDLDLLAAPGARGVTVSLCTTDEDALHRLDPRAPSARDRLASIEALHHAGIAVTVSVAPWVPGTTDVEAIAAQVPPGVQIVVAPLDVTAEAVRSQPIATQWTQATIDRAYRVAQRASVATPGVRWLHPVADRAPGTNPLTSMPPAPPGQAIAG